MKDRSGARLGKRIIGAEAAEAARATRKAQLKKGKGLGNRITGPLTTPARPTVALVTDEQLETGAEGAGETSTGDQGGAGEPVATLSITELEKALQENPELIDKLLAAELDRPEGAPRKGALRVILAAEQARDDGGREAVVAELKSLIKAKAK